MHPEKIGLIRVALEQLHLATGEQRIKRAAGFQELARFAQNIVTRPFILVQGYHIECVALLS